eukprot:scaffold1650_cov135-Cylindrotheca_fusiformis.AAC.1
MLPDWIASSGQNITVWEYHSVTDRPNGLLDGGDFVEEGHASIRAALRMRNNLPIMKMLNYIEDMGYKRPRRPSPN